MPIIHGIIFFKFLLALVAAGELARKKVLRCPACGFEFEVSYARAFACGGCPSSISCDYVRCPKCGEEFPEASALAHQLY